MRRANAFHILSLLLACLGTAGWSHAADLGSEAMLAGAVGLLLSAASAATLAVRVSRREREGLVLHLRQAAAAVHPADGRNALASIDADALGAAVDAVIAAARAQVSTLHLRARDLEAQLKSVALERDHAALERDHAQAAVAALADAVRGTAGLASTTSTPTSHPAVPPPAADAPEPSAVAREVARAQRGFVALASHELRTPLASIKAYAEMLVDGEAADARSRGEIYGVVHAEACRLGQAVENVLTLARLEGGLLEPALRPTGLAPLVDRAVEAVRPAAAAKHLTLDVQPAADGDGARRAGREAADDSDDVVSSAAAGPTARLDEDLIALTVANLLDNAVRATPDGGRVTVRVAADPARRVVGLTVRDEGDAIAPKDLPAVFDRTYGEGQGRVARAAGVGLTLARHVVEAIHGGRMFAESTPGAGSCLGFELPACEPTGPDGQEPDRDPRPATDSGVVASATLSDTSKSSVPN